MESKKCFKCNEIKPLSEFYKHPQMADGRLNKCKECNKDDVSKNYRVNIEHYKSYEKLRANIPHRKCSVRKAKSNWIKRNPIKRLASTIIGNAVRSGKIIKPLHCESCSSQPSRLHGHHDDYAFALVVRWLCPGCHSKWHKINGEGLNS